MDVDFGGVCFGTTRELKGDLLYLNLLGVPMGGIFTGLSVCPGDR